MPRYRFRDHGDCVVGAIDIEMPGHDGHLRVAAVGDDKADALGRAALVAERIASDPIMRALMPPQAVAAIKAAKGLAAASKRGSRVLRHFWGKLRGPGKKRLAEALHDEAVAREGATGSLEMPMLYEVGIRNPFRRKKKKKRTPPPRRQRDDMEQADEDEMPEASDDPGEDQELSDLSAQAAFDAAEGR